MSPNPLHLLSVAGARDCSAPYNTFKYHNPFAQSHSGETCLVSLGDVRVGVNPRTAGK